MDACDTSGPVRDECSPKKAVHRVLPNRTVLNVEVFYERGARVVYLRNKHEIGPLISHMHNVDVAKIFPVVDLSNARVR